MADSRKRIAGAFLIGGTLVAAAFVLGSPKDATTNSGSIIVAAPPREHIDVTDTNKDGVPNWQESLQATDPIIIDTATSTYERPKTVTGKFALTFFENLLRSKTYGAFGDTPEEVISETTEALAEEAKDVLFTQEDIVLMEVSNEALLKAYGNHVARIALSQKSAGSNEAMILQDTLRYGEKERLDDLEPIATSYVLMVKQMLETPVPQAYVKEHLDLLNAYNAIRSDIRGMQKVYEDPMYTFIRVKRYQDDVLGLKYALENLFNALYLQGKIQWEEGDPAHTLSDLIRTL